MRAFVSGVLVRAALLILLAAALVAPAEAQIGPAPGAGAGSPGGSAGQIQYNNSGAFGGRSPSGTGATVVTTTGTLTSGNCVKIDASGNMIDAGGACGGSSGVSSITTACPAGLSFATGAVTATGAIPTNAQIGTSYTIQASDCGKLLTFNNASAIAVTLPQAGTSGFLSGFFLAGVQNLGAGAVTITPTTSTVNGAASLTLASGQSAAGLVGDGTNYFAQVIPAPAGSSGQVQYNNSGAFGAYAKSGNGTTIASTTGALTNGDCVKIDASGNLVDSGGACAGSGSPGGSSGQIQYNNSGAFGGLPTVGSGTSVVKASGVSGNSGTVAQSSGALTNGDCAKFDANGNVIDAGAACAGASPWTYKAGLWYSPFEGAINTGGSVFPSINNTYCLPFRVNFTFTFDQWAGNMATVGATTAHFAIYANGYDATNKRNFPSGAPIASDNNTPVNTATPVTFTFAANVQLTPGLYWGCGQMGDTTGKYVSLANATVFPFASLAIGSTAPGSVAGTSNNIGLSYTGGSYGTWPNTASATSWTTTTIGYAPAAAVHVYSAP